MDTKEWTGIRAVFADDAIVETTASGGSLIVGADEFMAFLEPTLHEADERSGGRWRIKTSTLTRLHMDFTSAAP